MTDTYISFYLRNNRIHVFVDALRSIGSPKYVCFMIAEDGNTLILSPYKRKDFHSHRVPQDVYHGIGGFNLASMPLCQIVQLAQTLLLPATGNNSGIIQRELSGG